MSLEKDMIALQPNLKAFAVSLCGDAVRADDLVQETFLKAWDHKASYQEGTNLRAWLFTILRNTYFSEMRKGRREVEDVDGLKAEQMRAPDNPEDNMRWKDFASAWMSLLFEQQQAMMLVGVEGLDYEDAATMLGVAVGTIKSRVNRARRALSEMLGEELPKNALEQAWEKLQELNLGSDEGEDTPTILNEAAE
jgi:RNA polymerase sigma-70 factor (ECF subfamily)